ncbi:hypothetical protein LTR97_011209 [Elasticomyces elasticus]|uniref:CENP-V/GFA domain-containing protein n=1 Tax=Elasticomyces elasticus TaxID=574655 RepID=A0AAN7W7Y9_9PEZI|nr:hypothetical protein LTR97_011209 [Elasticomyces elasticus]
MPTATCLCGACHIVIDSILGTGICHCMTCRKSTSSTFSLNAVTTKDAFHLISGSPKSYGIIGDNGIPSKIFFCGECSSLMWTEYSPRPDLRIVKAGTIDGDDALADEKLQPLVEQYTKRRAPWLCEAVNAKQYEGQQDASSEDDKMADVMLQVVTQSPTAMSSYIFTTHGMQDLARHVNGPDANHIRDVQIVTRTLNPHSYDPENNYVKGEKGMLHLRRNAKHIWEADRTTLAGNGWNSASASFAAAFRLLAAADRNITIGITPTGPWDGSYGSHGLLQQLGANLQAEHFVKTGCGDAIVALLRASRTVNAPLSSLAFDLQIGGDLTWGPTFVALQQQIVTLGHPQLRSLQSLKIRFTGPYYLDSLVEWDLASMMVNAAPQLHTISVTWKETEETEEDEVDHGAEDFDVEGYSLMLEKVAAITTAAHIRTLVLVNAPCGRNDALFSRLSAQSFGLHKLSLVKIDVSQNDLLDFFLTQNSSLKGLTLDTVTMQGSSYWRATLRWMADNLNLDWLELRNLTCISRCESLGLDLPQVMCDGGTEGWWYSHGTYEGSEAVKEGLVALVEHGKYVWKERLRDCRIQDDSLPVASL